MFYLFLISNSQNRINGGEACKAGEAPRRFSLRGLRRPGKRSAERTASSLSSRRGEYCALLTPYGAEFARIRRRSQWWSPSGLARNKGEPVFLDWRSDRWMISSSPTGTRSQCLQVSYSLTKVVCGGPWIK